MEAAEQQPAGSRKKAITKVLILAAFIIGAIYVVRFTPVKTYLTAEA
jgi:hypothetical protein